MVLELFDDKGNISVLKMTIEDFFTEMKHLEESSQNIEESDKKNKADGEHQVTCMVATNNNHTSDSKLGSCQYQRNYPPCTDCGVKSTNNLGAEICFVCQCRWKIGRIERTRACPICCLKDLSRCHRCEEYKTPYYIKVALVKINDFLLREHKYRRYVLFLGMTQRFNMFRELIPLLDPFNLLTWQYLSFTADCRLNMEMYGYHVTLVMRDFFLKKIARRYNGVY